MSNHSPVTAAQFIKAWQAAASVSEVMTATGMKAPAVNARAYKYRKAGIKLKPMGNGTSQLDIAALNKLCK